MGADTESGRLKEAYGAAGSGEVARTYDAWAGSYDAEMASVGYRHPTICLALLARHLAPGAGPVLDAGAGTGLVGECLAILGYRPLEAVDISAGMLAAAAQKGVYDRLIEADLTGRLPFETARFAGAVCTGVFTTGHVGPEGVEELIRVLRPGAPLALSIKEAVWSGGFEARLAALEAEGRIARLEETAPYSSMPGVAGNAPSRSLALRRL